MNDPSPFSDDRFEHDTQHLYYLQEGLYASLQKAKPCFIIGSRGTGKTTLLRSLSWRERLGNESLRAQLGAERFANFIGVYIKLPTVQVDVIVAWLVEADEAIKRSIYSRYLELIQLQEILEAVAELEVAGVLKYSATAERNAVKQILDEFGSEVQLQGALERSPRSFLDLARSIHSVRRLIEKASQQGVEPKVLIGTIGSPAQFNHLSLEVAGRISNVVSGTAKQKIGFKVCFDEAETLDAFGVKVIATWVRLSAAPLHHVISFVSRPDSLSATFLPKLTVQSADAVILDLDNISDRQFDALAEGVAEIRIREFARQHPRLLRSRERAVFSTERLFGKLNLNFLLEDALRDSESPRARELLEAAAARSGVSSQDRIRLGDDSALPIYETYLSVRLNRELPDLNAPKWSKRRASSQKTRKPMVSAYLSIMKELRIAPRYAYADMIFQLSDSCIRDFLSNLEYVFRASEYTVDEFLRCSPMKATIQNSGLIKASHAKRKSLPTRGVNHPASTAKLVAGLGKLTELLQSQSEDGVSHLKSTERGIFQLTMPRVDGAMRRAVTLIVEAAEAGFLKIVSHSELLMRFRVHTSLAPAFGFSYRGAYYSSALEALEVLGFADAKDDAEIERLAIALYKNLDERKSGELFPRPKP